MRITRVETVLRRPDTSSKRLATLVILIFFTLYVASGLKGGTLLFAHSFGADEQTALLITTLVLCKI